MDPRLLRYYERELQHIREMGAEFAQEFPKIAGRLGIEGLEVTDPYVERLLEGFAFLAARVQLKVDAEFPRFTQHLLERVYPHYLAPLPSMAVVQLQPDQTEGSLLEGPTVARQTVLRSLLGKDEQTACEYRTAHEIRLWPLQLTAAEYLPTVAAVSALGALEPTGLTGLKAGVRLQLHTLGDVTFAQLAAQPQPLDDLPLFLRGSEALPLLLYEQVFGNALGVVVQSAQRPPAWQRVLPATCLRQAGFDDTQALLPYGPRSFQGYRLLQEYFAFPERYLFVELSGLRDAFSRCEGGELELIILLNRSEPRLEDVVSAQNFALFCTPAINLFPKRADRIHITDQRFEHHIVPDRARPLDFEVFAVTEAKGYGASGEDEQTFLPFYATNDASDGLRQAYYTLRREPRLLSSRQRRRGPRSVSYIGSEVFIALVDAQEAPYRANLRQLGMDTLCTNRDLPLHMPLGQGQTDFTLESSAPVAAVRCVSGPTAPRPSRAEREISWRLISHLSLNYLSLLDSDARQGAAALRELLKLYSDQQEAALRKQIDEGVRSISYRPVTRRLPLPGPIAFGRGLEITLNLDEAAFTGSGVFLLGAVLERFFAKYVAINTFTETLVTTPTRGEIMRWPVRSGLRPTL